MAASYPGAVKTFVTRVAGQAINAAHINDLQDEVNAIEAGLLNGTAPLTSSNATVSNLHVTGNSTLGSTITVGGKTYVFPSSGGSTGDLLLCTSTSGSTMTLEWRSLTAALASIPRVTVTHSAAQAIANSTSWTGLAWDTDADDGFGLHSTSANSSRIDFAKHSTGAYLVGASVTFDPKSLIERGITIRVNDSSHVAGQYALSVNNHTQTFTVSALVYAASTADYFTVMAFASGDASSVVAHSTGNPTRAWARLLGA